MEILNEECKSLKIDIIIERIKCIKASMKSTGGKEVREGVIQKLLQVSDEMEINKARKCENTSCDVDESNPMKKLKMWTEKKWCRREK